MPLVDLQGPHSCGVIDGGVLIAFDLAAIFLSKAQELHIDLYLVAWDLFGVAARMDGSPADISWQAADSVAFESAVNARTGGLEAVIALKVPGDSLGT